jgi:PAS domain S-box-containing protein
MKKSNVVIAVSIAAALSFWVLDAVVDYLAHYDEPFLELLLFNEREIYFRLFFSGCFLLFGFFMARSVSRHEHVEGDLLESEEKYDKFIETAGDAIFMADAETGVLIGANREAEELIGMSSDEIVGMHQSRLHPKEEAERYGEIFKDHVEKGKVISEDLFVCHKDGHKVPVQISASVSESGGRKVLQGIFRDMTGRRRAEDDRREANRTLQALIEYSPLAIIGMDVDMTVKTWNPAAELVFGWSKAEVIGRPNPIVPEQKEDEYRSLIEELIQGRVYRAKELQRQRKDGVLLDLSASLAALQDTNGKFMGVMAVFEDVTERKRMEEALRETGTRLQTLIDAIPDMVFFKDAEGRHLLVNKAHEEFFGHSLEDIQGKTVEDLLPPEVAEYCRKGDEETIRNKKPVHTEERAKDKDGNSITLDTIKVPIYDEGGSAAGLVGVARDITERKRAEEELRLFSEAVEGALDGIQIVDLEGRIIYSNKVVEEMYGYSPEDLKGRHVNDMNVDPEFAGREIIPMILEAGCWAGELMVRHKGGREFPVWLTTSLVKDPDGEPIAMVGVIRDVTERKRMEEALRETSTRLQTLIDAIPDIVFFKDAEGRHLLVNRAHERFSGYSLAEVWGKTSEDLMPPELAEQCRRSDEEMMREGRRFQTEEQATDKDGNRIILDTIKVPIYDEGGSAAGLVGVARDITWRKRAEEALMESEQRFRGAFENAAVGASMVDLKGRFLKVNRRLCELLGYPENELLSKTFSDITHPEDVQIGLDQLARMLRGEYDYAWFEKRYLHKEGHEINMLVSPSLIRDREGSPQYFVGLWQDITERKRAEKALRVAHDELEVKVRERTAELSWESGVNAAMAEFSMALVQSASVDEIAYFVLEYSKVTTESEFGFMGYIETKTGHLVSPTLTGDVREAYGVRDNLRVEEFTGLWGWVLKNRKPLLSNSPGEDPRSSGAHMPFRSFLSVPAMIGNTLVGQLVLGDSSRDYTEKDQVLIERLSALYALGIQRKRAEEAQRESEERFRRIFKQNQDAIVIFRYEAPVVIDVNAAAERLFGYSGHELIKREVLFFGPEEHGEFREAAGGSDTPEGIINILRKTYRRKDGSKVAVAVMSQVMRLGDADVLCCSFRDITEKLRMEEEAKLSQAQLIHANKMTSLGTLVSGVVHEINNPNHYIMSNSAVLSRAWKDTGKILEEYFNESGEFLLGGLPFSEMRDVVPKLIRGVNEGSVRINNIVENLKNFARQDRADLDGMVDVNQVVMDSTSILGSQIRKHTEDFHVQCHEAPLYVKGSAQQLEQVLINLIMNSLQALPDRELGVRVGTSLDEELRYVVIRVSDDGVGMSKDIVDKITEPFFTTKLDYGGTGLGLSISYSIIKDHNAFLEFQSEPGKGTTVTVTLPAYEGGAV